jgi:hypothetical protein
VRINPFELAELAGPRELAGKREVRQVPPLRTGLKHAPGALHRLRENETLRNVLGARLLAIHVLAGLGRLHGHRRMPIRSRRDQHRVDVVAVEQLAKVAMHVAVFGSVSAVDHLFDERAAGLLHIAHGRTLDVRAIQKAAEVVHAAAADADAAQQNPLARRDGPVQTEGRAGDDRRRHHSGAGRREGGFQKATPWEPSFRR